MGGLRPNDRVRVRKRRTDEIVALLEKLWRERGLTLILVSHDSTVTRRAQRVAVMDGGRVSFE